MPTTSIASADSRQMMKRALPMIVAQHRIKVEWLTRIERV
jgi:hypothetical protein